MIDFIREYTFQHESEIMEMIEAIIEGTKIKNIIEIGTKNGGTAYLWAQLVRPYGGKVYCIDKKFGWKDDYLIYHETKFFDQIVELEGDSDDPKILSLLESALNGTKVELLFIDGAHDYEMVEKDFLNYSKFVSPKGWIAFHDIINSKVEVGKFWEELKYRYEYFEFLLDNQPLKKRKPAFHGPDDKNGIGLIRW